MVVGVLRFPIYNRGRKIVIAPLIEKINNLHHHKFNRTSYRKSKIKGGKTKSKILINTIRPNN